MDLELWLSLEVGNATGGVDRITRSMTQFLELQQELNEVLRKPVIGNMEFD